MVYIDKLESGRAVRMAPRIGTRVSLHSSSVGKAWLAALPEPELAEWLPRLVMVAHTRFTRTEPAAVREEIAATRRRGYAVDLQENELDICCYGRAIPGRDGRALGCVSLSMPRYRFEELAPETADAALRRCVEGIAAAASGTLS